VPKTYTARLATRVTANVDTRLRQFALLSRQRLSHVLDDVLDSALPSAEELSAELARRASHRRNRGAPTCPSPHPMPPAARRHQRPHLAPSKAARTGHAGGCTAQWPPSRYSRPPRRR
jgi:hypothetical protein